MNCIDQPTYWPKNLGASVTKQPKLIAQATHGEETTRERLIQILEDPDLQRARFAVAYARWEGIGLFSSSIEDLLARGGRFESIYGAGNGVTTPDALYYGLLLRQLFPTRTYAGFVEDEYANATFHPKYYEFRYSDKIVLIVGSSNLTGAGFQRNSEVSVEVTFARGGPDEKALEVYWSAIKKGATLVALDHVARIASMSGSGKEGKSPTELLKAGKPHLPASTKPRPRPLFQKILNLESPTQAKKDKLLSEFSAISDRPKHLYIQILSRETGGQNGNSGSAVQLPVATLGAYFGVARNEDRSIRLMFPNGPLDTNITHFSNNTHQVRIHPILSIARPAILHLTRIAENLYDASFIPPNDYQKVLKSKCIHQSRKNSRLWGFS